MGNSLFSRITTIGPLAAVIFAAGWVFYTVTQSALTTSSVATGLMVEIAAADALGNDRAIDDLLDTAWSSINPSSDKRGINEPVILGLLEIQIELRRLLGNSFRTNVPVLSSDPACRVDIIEQQLIWLYGASVATPDGATASPTTSALARFARQLACISGLQTAVLETAMVSSFNTVALRLEARGLAQVTPFLARYFAPLQLLLLDNRKHVGTASASWRWFQRWRPLLLKQVAYGGWATDRVYLWDRRNAVLAGLAVCSAGDQRPYCADTKLLLNTIGEPLALGRGFCSFAGMIATGPSWTENGQSYVCPLNFCPDRKRHAPKTLITDSEMAHLQALWPGYISIDDRKLIGELCHETWADKQAAYHDPTECLVGYYGSRAENPFEHHLACKQTADVIGMTEEISTEGPMPLDVDLLGVPQNPSCELLRVDTSQTLPAPIGCGAGEPCLDYSSFLKKPPEAATTDSTGLLADPLLTETLLNPQDQGTAAFCDNPADCTTSCSAISQQITRKNSCAIISDEDPDDPPLVMPIELLGEPLLLTSWDATTHVSSAEDPSSEESFRACSLGLANATRPAVHCGLITCPDGLPAVGTAGACGCRTEFGGNYTKELLCEKLRCADGSKPDSGCNCYAPEAPPFSVSAPRRN